MVLPHSPEKLRRHVTEHRDKLPSGAKRSLSDLVEYAGNIQNHRVEYDRAIAEIAREDAVARG